MHEEAGLNPKESCSQAISCASWMQGRPGLSIIHPIQHPCVDGTGRLSLQSLDRWPSSHIRLVDVVQDAFTALSGQPSYASPSHSRPGLRSLQSHCPVQLVAAWQVRTRLHLKH